MLGSTWSKLAAVFIAGLPLCVVGGALYSIASGKGFIDGCIQAYGALYKIPGGSRCACNCRLVNVRLQVRVLDWLREVASLCHPQV